jgi:Fic family protein
VRLDDGNGRVARVMMNAELIAGAQARIIVPTVFRDDYLDGLRMLSRQDRPGVLIQALRLAPRSQSRSAARSLRRRQRRSRSRYRPGSRPFIQWKVNLASDAALA